MIGDNDDDDDGELLGFLLDLSTLHATQDGS